MATSIKISQLPAKGANLEATDLLEVSEFNGTGYVSKSITGQEIIDSIPIPSSGITIGTTAITSGTVGRVLFEGTGNVVQESANLFWDNTNGRLGIGVVGAIPQKLTVEFPFVGTVTNRVGFYDLDSGLATTGSRSLLALGFADARTSGIGVISISNSGFEQGLTFHTSSGGTGLISNPSGSEAMRITNTRNVLINTTTDAGFKLNVNGTARVSSTLTVSGQTGSGGVNSIISSNNDLSLACGYYFRFRATNDGNAIIFGSDWDGTQTYLYSNRRMVFGAALINTSAILQADSTTRGFLPPRMTTTQKNAIASPAAGLMVYDTTLNLISVFNGTIWI
jgi:hypothetical protein